MGGRRVLAIVLTTGLLVGALGSITTGFEYHQSTDTVSITQSPEDVTAEPETKVTFVVNLTVPDDYNGPAIDVDLPAGWEIVSQESSGRYRESEHQWIWLSGGNKSVNYTVRVPPNATGGAYTIVANGSAVNPDTDEVVWDRTSSTVDVQESTATTPTPSPTETATRTSSDRSETTPTPSPTTRSATANPGGTTTSVTPSPETDTPTERSTAAETPATTRRTTTADGTATDTTTVATTGSPSRSTTAATLIPTPTPDPSADPTTATPGQPGFGLVVAVGAVLSMGVLASRQARTDR